MWASLSARRAWIEILPLNYVTNGRPVALRKESVDRNSTYVIRLPRCQVSLSARRAWIEIASSLDDILAGVSLSARRAWIEIIDDLEPSRTRKVALRKESVDRNNTSQRV